MQGSEAKLVNEGAREAVLKPLATNCEKALEQLSFLKQRQQI